MSLSNSDIEILYERYFEKIYRFFYYKTLNKEIAEDLTSHSFLTFIKQSKSQKEIQNPKNYLFGITKFTFLAYLKKKYKQELPLLNEDFAVYIDNFLDEIDDKPTLEDKASKYIKMLPEKQKRVLHMRLIEKLSLAEIAAKLGKNMNYVKTTQKRGIKNLKKMLALSG